MKRQGTTLVVSQMPNIDSGFSRCGIIKSENKPAGAKAQLSLLGAFGTTIQAAEKLPILANLVPGTNFSPFSACFAAVSSFHFASESR
ncbi:MAG: hypothetical protein WAN35_07645, partial [Terracidiphilus sp.]